MTSTGENRSDKPGKIEKQDRIKEIQEWQDNQYNPGYYTGGRIPPLVSSSSDRPIVVWFLVLTGLPALVIGIITALEAQTPVQLAAAALQTILGTLVIVFGVVRFRRIRKAKGRRK